MPIDYADIASKFWPMNRNPSDAEIEKLCPSAKQWVRAMISQIDRSLATGKRLDEDALEEIGAAYLSGASQVLHAQIKNDGHPGVTPHALNNALIEAGRTLGLTYGPAKKPD